MKRNITISNRAIGPVVPGSLKRGKKVNRATGTGFSAKDIIYEGQKGRMVQFTLKNTTDEDKTYAVFPGALETVAEIQRYTGLQVDGIVTEGDIKAADGTTVIGTCSSKTLPLAQKWTVRHPMVFCMIKLQTDNESQFSKEFGLTSYEIGQQNGQTSIRPLDHISPNQQIKTLCELQTNIQLDDATVFFMEVAAGRELQVSMQMFAETNQAAALAAAVAKA